MFNNSYSTDLTLDLLLIFYFIVPFIHPFRPQSIGKDITNHKDKEGKEFVKEYIEIVKGKGSGWVNYKWPKPGEEKLSDKTTYVLKVDENFYVTAGYFK